MSPFLNQENGTLLSSNNAMERRKSNALDRVIIKGVSIREASSGGCPSRKDGQHDRNNGIIGDY